MKFSSHRRHRKCWNLL